MSMDWDQFRFVLAVADAGSMSAAAKRLHVDPATIARRLDALEAHLRCRLFDRTRRGLTPTKAGSKLIVRARRMEGEVTALGFELSTEDRGLSGSVAVTATEPIAAGLVAPALPAFHAANPGISIELVTDIRTLDLARREADIALRLTRTLEGDLRVRRLGTVAYGLYASPSYVDRRGRPDPASGFAGHFLIDWPADYLVIPQVPWLRRSAAGATTVLRSSSAMTRLAATAAGTGIALLPCILGDSEPRLVRIPTEPPPTQELWLVSHRDLVRVPRIRATLDFLAETARRERRRLEGRD
jgi:DNA-binding transcriptional LysR family regulator